MIKRCPKCATELPIEAFGRSKNYRDGLSCWCKACSRANIARLRATPEGAERHRQQELARHRANPEIGRQKAREWHHANKGRAKDTAKANGARRRDCPGYMVWEAERQRIWYGRNSAKGVAKVRQRQTAELRASPPWLTVIQRAEILAVYEIAVALTAQTGIKHHVDHIVPLRGTTFSGLHVPWNLRAIPASENCSKGNALPDESDFIAHPRAA